MTSPWFMITHPGLSDPSQQWAGRKDRDMDELRKKITDPGLRAIAEHGDDSRCVEVIIELDLPPTAAPPGHVRHGYGRRGGVASLAPDADEPFDPHDAEMDRLERDLRS